MIVTTAITFSRPWNTWDATWIEADVPGPWAVDNTLHHRWWGIINTETGSTKKIGPLTRPRSHSKVNYFDRAMEEANKRNLAHQAVVRGAWQIAFVTELITSVKKEVFAKINAGHIPPEWNGLELREYLAHKFAGVVFKGAIGLRRKRKYQSTVLANNL